MKTRKRIFAATILSAFAAIVAGLFLAPTTTQAQRDPAPRIRAAFFGLQSLSPGQTARLNVVNPVLDRTNPDGSSEQRTRHVTVNFDIYAPIPEDGRLRFVRRVSRTAALRPGRGITLEFTAEQAGQLVDPSIFMGIEPTPFLVPAVLPASLEIREGERTILTPAGVIRAFNPQPEPPIPQ
ncbi:MAG: hypothetical protein AB7W44_18415 [Pyrinomonadaceae bacterium]